MEIDESLIYRSWTAENAGTAYPFSPVSRLDLPDGTTLGGIFTDAAIYPAAAVAGLRIVSVAIDSASATLNLGTDAGVLASVAFSLLSPPSSLPLADASGRRAGLLVASPNALAAFRTWPQGTTNLPAGYAEFCTSVCFPPAPAGLSGLELAGGVDLSGAVWCVGEGGVVLSESRNAAGTEIRVDVTGDPLFRRSQCGGGGGFATPRFIRSLLVQAANQTFSVFPDSRGNLKIAVYAPPNTRSPLRFARTPAGAKISFLDGTN